MPRIRSIKPCFFRHEGLQELEVKHKGKYPMFVFSGLWGHCDKLGRFRWKPKTLKLDILPFIPFDMEKTLGLLEQAGYLKRYEVSGEQYGFIPTFTEHQRISGKESQEPAEYPDPIDFIDGSPVKQPGSISEAVEMAGREGKGIGREQEGNCPARAALPVSEVVSLWNSIQGLPRAESTTGPIEKAIARRIQEHPSLEWFSDIFHRVSRSDFLSGRKSDFAATIDWVLGPKNLAKILNGNYDNRTNGIHAPPMKSAPIPPFPGPEDPVGRNLWRKSYGDPALLRRA